jgi:hypothetical protein
MAIVTNDTSPKGCCGNPMKFCDPELGGCTLNSSACSRWSAVAVATLGLVTAAGGAALLLYTSLDEGSNRVSYGAGGAWMAFAGASVMVTGMMRFCSGTPDHDQGEHAPLI